MVMALDHIRVLDLTTLLPGPFATAILADFGAEVIKIESPSRPDLMRLLPPLVGDTKAKNRLSAVFHSLNRNKKSLTVNLKTAEGKQLFLNLKRRILASSSFFSDNFSSPSSRNLSIESKLLESCRSPKISIFAKSSLFQVFNALCNLLLKPSI